MSTSLIFLLLIISVGLGGLLVSSIDKKKNEQIIKLLLAFSGGFLLAIAFTHFIPELYEETSINIGIFILIGFLIQLILEFFSGGIEHGHIHAHKGDKLPFGLLIALSLHSFLEGIPLGAQEIGHDVATAHHHSDDHALLLGILLHRIPVAVALMTLLTTSGVNKIKSWLMLGLFALTSPLGMLLGMSDISILHSMNFNSILAIVVGMFLHISTTIIFETSENHKFNFLKLLTIIGGCGLAFLIH